MGTRIALIDVATGREFLLTDQAESLSALTFSPDGRTLASGSASGTILFWDLTAERACRVETSKGVETVIGISYHAGGMKDIPLKRSYHDSRRCWLRCD